MVVGLFMGVLGGMFVLGVVTTRANAFGALVGVFSGAGATFALNRFTGVNGFVYTAVGITTCVVMGYLASLLRPSPKEESLRGLTLKTQ